ncbi:hypothetical protein BJ508DRAFT_322561 [Ascobolus immersus RN42]|uniref:Uncharacterized protein n=1 Tax=Ascobolus immersus RN42 TaxID=1160509 RepID=A0A3N4IIQ6_ASCIM|nr:hypothetical protein BJ508DRAFT_322561 [Ascobolus immersus RN42]
MIYAIWTGNRDVVEKGKYRYSVYAETEYVVLVFSILTNFLIFLCSTVVLSHLRLNKSEWARALIFVAIFFLSFVLSISRLVSKALDLTIPLYVLTTAEAYTAAWAAMIPACRVWMSRFQDEGATGGVRRATEDARGITTRKLSRGDLMLMESINGMGIDRRVSDLDGLTRDPSQQSTHSKRSNIQTGTGRIMMDSKIDEIFIIPFKTSK